MTTSPDATTEQLMKAAVSHLRRARDEDDRATRARELRNAADILVELRSRVTTEDGTPDWSGRNWENRQVVSEICRDAGLGTDGQSSMKSAIRYHVGNALRDRLDAEALTGAGLIQDSPRERNYAREGVADRDVLIRDVISEATRLANRLEVVGMPSTPLSTSDHARLANATRKLRSWASSAMLESNAPVAEAGLLPDQYSALLGFLSAFTASPEATSESS